MNRRDHHLSTLLIIASLTTAAARGGDGGRVVFSARRGPTSGDCARGRDAAFSLMLFKHHPPQHAPQARLQGRGGWKRRLFDGRHRATTGGMAARALASDDDEPQTRDAERLDRRTTATGAPAAGAPRATTLGREIAVIALPALAGLAIEPLASLVDVAVVGRVLGTEVRWFDCSMVRWFDGSMSARIEWDR